MKLYVQNMKSKIVTVVLVLLGACRPQSTSTNGGKSNAVENEGDTVLTGEMRVFDPTDKLKGVKTDEE